MASEVVPAAVGRPQAHRRPRAVRRVRRTGGVGGEVAQVGSTAGLHASPLDSSRRTRVVEAGRRCSRLATEAAESIKPDPAMLREAQRLFGRFAQRSPGRCCLPPSRSRTPRRSAPTCWQQRVAWRTIWCGECVVPLQFLLVVTQLAIDDDDARRLWQPPSEPSPASGSVMPWHVCTALRLYHQTIRQKLIDDARSKGADAEADFGGEAVEPGGPPGHSADVQHHGVRGTRALWDLLDRR